MLLYKTCFLEIGSSYGTATLSPSFLALPAPCAGFTSVSRLLYDTVVIVLHLSVERGRGDGAPSRVGICEGQRTELFETWSSPPWCLQRLNLGLQA